MNESLDEGGKMGGRRQVVEWRNSIPFRCSPLSLLAACRFGKINSSQAALGPRGAPTHMEASGHWWASHLPREFIGVDSGK